MPDRTDLEGAILALEQLLDGYNELAGEQMPGWLFTIGEHVTRLRHEFEQAAET